jgi:hypothetical protein
MGQNKAAFDFGLRIRNCVLGKNRLKRIKHAGLQAVRQTGIADSLKTTNPRFRQKMPKTDWTNRILNNV